MSETRLWIAGAVLVMAFGCGGDDDGGGDPRELPEGGGLRVEFINVGASLAAVFGMEPPEGDRFYFDVTETHLFRDQTPERRDFPPPVLAETSDGTTCYDVAGPYAYWLATEAQNQAIIDTRTYLDVGPGVSVSGPSSFSLDLVGLDNTPDPLRQEVHGRIYLPPPADLFPADSIPSGWFDMSPSDLPDDLPEFAPTNGVMMWSGESVDRFGAYRPAAHGLADPVETDYMMRGLALRSDEDVTVTLTGLDRSGEVDVMWGMGLAKIVNGVPTLDVLCFQLNPANDTVTIPKEVSARVGPFGTVTVASFGALVYEYDGRQFYTTAFSCLLSSFCVDDPNATDGICAAPE